MAARTLTQHLLDVGRDARGSEYAHILSAVAVAVKLTAAMVRSGRSTRYGAGADSKRARKSG